MTRKVFWDDPYLTSLRTTLVDVADDEVQVAETILFAFSGGQERDHGSIGGQEVIDAHWDGPNLVYTLPTGHGLVAGYAVVVVIDSERRSRLRRLHMATEIVLELLTQDDPSLSKVGAHIGADRARIDFACDESLAPRLGRFEEAANSMISADLEITSAFSDEAAERRYWEIPDFARVPCSGTHPRRTGEIGLIRLRRANPGRGKERVEVTLADATTGG